MHHVYFSMCNLLCPFVRAKIKTYSFLLKNSYWIEKKRFIDAKSESFIVFSRVLQYVYTFCTSSVADTQTAWGSISSFISACTLMLFLMRQLPVHTSPLLKHKTLRFSQIHPTLLCKAMTVNNSLSKEWRACFLWPASYIDHKLQIQAVYWLNVPILIKKIPLRA